ARLQVEKDRLQAEIDKEIRLKAERQVIGNRLKRATEATRGSLYNMPSEASEVAEYMERIFVLCEVEQDLRINLLTPYLTDKARKAVMSMPTEEFSKYESWKEVILREYRLTATAYRLQFLQTTRIVGESCSQFLSRL